MNVSTFFLVLLKPKQQLFIFIDYRNSVSGTYSKRPRTDLATSAGRIFLSGNHTIVITVTFELSESLLTMAIYSVVCTPNLIVIISDLVAKEVN